MTPLDTARVPGAFSGPAINTGHNAVAWDGAASPPLHLNATSILVAAAMDGTRTIADIAAHVLPMFPAGAPTPEHMHIFVDRLADSFESYGLLDGTLGYSRHRRDQLRVQPPTVCARRLYRLNDSRLFLVDVGYRRIALSVADEQLAEELAFVLARYLVDEPIDLSAVPLELAVVPAEATDRGVGVGLHHLYGPDNRTLIRSTALDDVVAGTLQYLGNELAVATDPSAVWFRGTVLEHRGQHAFVVSPGVFRVWKTTRRRIEAAGFAVCAGSNLRISDDASSIDAPIVEIDDAGLIQRCASSATRGPRHSFASLRSWTSILGLALQNEGGSAIDDPASEAAFELVHQAFLLRCSADRSRWSGGDPLATFRVLDAAWALARRAGRHCSARLDHEFVDALLSVELQDVQR